MDAWFFQALLTFSPVNGVVPVAQSSYYKDVLIDLPTIFIEMGDSIGWRLSNRSDFVVKHGGSSNLLMN